MSQSNVPIKRADDKLLSAERPRSLLCSECGHSALPTVLTLAPTKRPKANLRPNLVVHPNFSLPRLSLAFISENQESQTNLVAEPDASLLSDLRLHPSA